MLYFSILTRPGQPDTIGLMATGVWLGQHCVAAWPPLIGEERRPITPGMPGIMVRMQLISAGELSSQMSNLDLLAGVWATTVLIRLCSAVSCRSYSTSHLMKPGRACILALTIGAFSSDRNSGPLLI